MLNNYKIDGIENQSQVSPKLTNSFFYFSNNLGIEELGHEHHHHHHHHSSGLWVSFTNQAS
jgi:hypothetical protein